MKFSNGNPSWKYNFTWKWFNTKTSCYDCFLKAITIKSLSWHGQQAATDNNPACARGINLRDLIGLFGGKYFF